MALNKENNLNTKVITRSEYRRNKLLSETQSIVNNVTDEEQLLRGTSWMTAASILSRVLGALYIIPWVAWFGTFYNQANALFSKGYNVYSIALMISTAGIPAAISKLIAHYNALDEYNVGFDLFKKGMLLSVITGLVAAILMLLAAPMHSLTNGDPNVAPVLRTLSLAIFVFPSLSMMRGLFQGYHMMAPSAISQFIEQIVRVIYMLSTTYLIMVLGKNPTKHWPLAVEQSTFAAAVGAIAGILLLFYEFYKYRNYFRKCSLISKNAINVSTTKLFKEIVWEAIPFTIVPSAIAIYQLFDQVTFFKIMRMTTNLSYSMQNNLYAYFDFNANKIIMIVVSLASAISATAIPLLTEANTKNDIKGTNKQIIFTLKLFSFVMLPAALGMAAVAIPLYTLFYHYSLSGSIVLEYSAYLSILFGLYTILATIMQGIDENIKIINYLIIGFIVKCILQYPMVAIAQPIGPLLATTIGFGVSCWLVVKYLKRQYKIKYSVMFSSIDKIMLYSLITFIVARLIILLLGHVINLQYKLLALLAVALAAIIGGGLYAFLSLKSHLADELLGDRVDKLRKLLKLSK